MLQLRRDAVQVLISSMISECMAPAPILSALCPSLWAADPHLQKSYNTGVQDTHVHGHTFWSCSITAQDCNSITLMLFNHRSRLQQRKCSPMPQPTSRTRSLGRRSSMATNSCASAQHQRRPQVAAWVAPMSA